MLVGEATCIKQRHHKLTAFDKAAAGSVEPQSGDRTPAAGTSHQESSAAARGRGMGMQRRRWDGRQQLQLLLVPPPLQSVWYTRTAPARQKREASVKGWLGEGVGGAYGQYMPATGSSSQRMDLPEPRPSLSGTLVAMLRCWRSTQEVGCLALQLSSCGGRCTWEQLSVVGSVDPQGLSSDAF